MAIAVPGSWRGVNVRTRYTKTQVETLLPVALSGMESDLPSPVLEYRQGCGDRPSDLPASLADMRRAWERCRISRKSRRAIFSHLVVGFKLHEIAAREGVTEKAIRVREEAAIQAILAYLNGGNSG